MKTAHLRRMRKNDRSTPLAWEMCIRDRIGMHLKRVAVPVRLSLSKIGEANILCARTRPKLIGGERAKYTEED